MEMKRIHEVISTISPISPFFPSYVSYTIEYPDGVPEEELEEYNRAREAIFSVQKDALEYLDNYDHLLNGVHRLYDDIGELEFYYGKDNQE